MRDTTFFEEVSSVHLLCSYVYLPQKCSCVYLIVVGSYVYIKCTHCHEASSNKTLCMYVSGFFKENPIPRVAYFNCDKLLLEFKCMYQVSSKKYYIAIM